MFTLEKTEKILKHNYLYGVGVIGGIPERRPDFGVAFGPKSFLSQDNQFVGFNGGHMDLAILSFAEFDMLGILILAYWRSILWLWWVY